VCSGKIKFKNGNPSAGHPITAGMTARLKMSILYEKKSFLTPISGIRLKLANLGGAVNPNTGRPEYPP
jgi:hypothetical protein